MAPKQPETYEKLRRPKLVVMALCAIPALAGLVGLVAGLYLIFGKGETGIGIVMALLTGLTSLGFGSYIIGSVGPYLHPDRYFLRLANDHIIFSAGSEHVIPFESIREIRTITATPTKPGMPVTQWTNFRYEEDGAEHQLQICLHDYSNKDLEQRIRRAWRNWQESR